MTPHAPDSRTPADRAGHSEPIPTSPGSAAGDQTRDAAGDRPPEIGEQTSGLTGAAPPFPLTEAALTQPRFGGGVSLMIAFLGLVGAAVGIGWVWLDSRVG